MLSLRKRQNIPINQGFRAVVVVGWRADLNGRRPVAQIAGDLGFVLNEESPYGSFDAQDQIIRPGDIQDFSPWESGVRRVKKLRVADRRIQSNGEFAKADDSITIRIVSRSDNTDIGLAGIKYRDPILEHVRVDLRQGAQVLRCFSLAVTRGEPKLVHSRPLWCESRDR